MTNLLSADWMRARKTRLFWVLLAAAAVMTFPPFRAELSEAGRICDPAEGWVIDGALFQAVMVHAMTLTAFIPLFLGADYHDGTIRNKLIAGHSRGRIYLSGLCTCMLIVLCLAAAAAAANTLQALATHGVIGMDAAHFALHVLASVCCVMAFASLYVMLSMLISGRAYALLACICAFAAMMFVTAGLERVLSQAEIARYVVDFVNGEPVWSEPYLNPAYVGGTKRAVLEWVYDFLPTGQGSQLSNMEADRVVRFPAHSLLFILLTSGVGLLSFRKKDIS